MRASAVVTGATKGIGFAITSMLIQRGYYVYAVGRDFKMCDFHRDDVKQLCIDLASKDEIQSLKQIQKDKSVEILVNAAGFGAFCPHEELSIDVIEKMVAVNLTAPLVLSQMFLRNLKHNSGYIFNINSISGIKSAPFGAVYGATKAGLKHFGTSVFDEARKSGLKVINLSPDITKTNFFDSLHFSYHLDKDTHIHPNDIAKTVAFCLDSSSHITLTDITIQPQKFRIQKN